jgi:hypothetical protein
MRLGTEIGRCAYCNLEMGPRMALEVARSCGARLERLDFWEDLGAFLRSGRSAQVLAVDSVQCLGRGFARLVKSAHDWATREQATIIWVNQLNGKGKAKGGPALGHAGDIELWFRPGPIAGTAVCATQKNRLSLPSRSQAVLALGPDVALPAEEP